MVRFYDPKDAADLARVEALLQAEGIEYFLRSEGVEGIGPQEILVAEEDFPKAEEALRRTALH
jgi:hypothetical protein